MRPAVSAEVRHNLELLGARRRHRVVRNLWRNRLMYLMLLPGLAVILIYRYVPMYGLTIAFKDFRVSRRRPQGAADPLRHHPDNSTGNRHNISHWQEVDGELVWWAVNPGTKEAIRYFRELYQNGYVDQEFPIMTRPEWLDMQRQDKYCTLWWWNTHLDEGYSAWWTEFKRAVPHGEVDFIPPAAGPDGRREMPGQGVIGERRAAHILFAGGKHPDKIIQVLDYLASDEGADVAAFGIPGVHWERGENKVTRFIDTAEDQAAAGNYIFSWFFRRSNMMVTSPLVLENRNAYIDYVVRPIIEQRVPAEGEFRAGLSGLEESRLLRMQIESDIDLDAEWDAYIKEWHDSGGQQIVDEKTAVWKESM